MYIVLYINTCMSIHVQLENSTFLADIENHCLLTEQIIDCIHLTTQLYSCNAYTCTLYMYSQITTSHWAISGLTAPLYVYMILVTYCKLTIADSKINTCTCIYMHMHNYTGIYIYMHMYNVMPTVWNEE